MACQALRMLENLPGVGTVIDGDDQERVARLLTDLLSVMDARSERFAGEHAATLAEYRAGGGEDLPRILVLVDGFAAFRERFDALGTAPVFQAFCRLLLEGRAAGVHIALTADRLGTIPSALQAGITRRVNLRQADDSQYAISNVPKGMLGPESPPGRAVVDAREMQFAVTGGSASVSAQAAGITELAAALRTAGAPETAAIRALPALVEADAIEAAVGRRPVLGVSGTTLSPLPIDASGPFLLGGGVQSGRSNALRWLVRALRTAEPTALTFYAGPSTSSLAREFPWTMTAVTPEEAMELCQGVAERMQSAPEGIRLIAVIEALGDLQSTIAEQAVIALAKASRRTGHTVVAEGESHVLASGWPLYTEFKVARRGIVLQPSSDDGEAVLRTPFPRIQRDEFPPGRGIAVLGREVHRVQVPLLAPQVPPAEDKG